MKEADDSGEESGRAAPQGGQVGGRIPITGENPDSGEPLESDLRIAAPRTAAAKRILEGIFVNLISAAILWLAARLAGFGVERRGITAAAVAVLVGALIVWLVSFLSRPPNLSWEAPGWAWPLRAAINFLNLTTVLGLLLALLGRASIKLLPPTPPPAYASIRKKRIWLATGYRRRSPNRRIFTVGNVLISSGDPESLLANESLLAHESRHSTQYAFCLGLPAIPLYGLCCFWSWFRTGDLAARNVFEVRAGLAMGGFTGYFPVKHRTLKFWLIVGFVVCSVAGVLAWLLFR